jgi:hypothetical protein
MICIGDGAEEDEYIAPFKRETEARVIYNGPEGLSEGGRGL